jgi:hypothetical protein
LEYSVYLQSKNINIMTRYIVRCTVTAKQTSIVAMDTHATIELLDAAFFVQSAPRLYGEQNAGFIDLHSSGKMLHKDYDSEGSVGKNLWP